MYSIAFPKIFNNTTTSIYSDHEATKSNLELLLKSEKYSLFGDPYFGSNFKKLTFEQNNSILRDLVIDDIYTNILTFIPQLRIKRSDITINSARAEISVTIKALNLLDYTTDLYNISLTVNEEI